MGIFGGGDDVTITIGGQSDGLQGAVKASEDALRSLSSAADSGKASFTGYRFTMRSVGNDLLKNLGTFGATVVTLNSLLGVVGTIGGAFMGAVSGVAQFVESLAQVAVSDAWQALSFGADEAERLGQAMFDLSNQTEKNVNTWKFIYGGAQNASDLAAWTQQFSMQIPYTRQDLMNAITALGRTGMTEGDIKQYMSTVADLGTLNPNLDLTQVAFAIQGAEHGYTRMLRYELGINPDDLKAYGLAIDNHGHITDTSTLMPALQKFASARGIGGAAQRTATGTFWGAASSFEDRIQNFLLAAGGTQADGSISQGSFFGNIKQDLVDLSSWIDAHQTELKALADLVSQLYGGGTELARDALTSFVEALHSTGIDTQLLADITDFAHWLNDPATQEGAREFGTMLGQLTGVAGIDLRGIFGSFWQGVTGSGVGQAIVTDIQNAINWLSDPKNQEQLNRISLALGGGIGVALQSIANSLGIIMNDATTMMQRMRPEDIQLIALAFLDLGGAIQGATIMIGDLGLVMGDIGHIIEDLGAGNYNAVWRDSEQIIIDQGNTIGQFQQAVAQQQKLAQQIQTNPLVGGQGNSGGQTPAHGDLSKAIAAARIAQETSGDTMGHGRAASLLGANLTENVAHGLVGNLSTMTRAGQQVAGQFAEALIAASSGQMGTLGQQVADTLAQAIQARIAQEFRLQGTQGTAAAQMPGGYGRFAFGGGRAPW